MNESDWTDGSYPQAMLDFLDEAASSRKLRLYACACVRRKWHLLTDERSRRAVELAERFADQQASAEELASAENAAWDAQLKGVDAPFYSAKAAFFATASSATFAPREAADAMNSATICDPNDPEEEAWQASALRDVLGNPFRPVTIDPAWRTTIVVSLAQAIYDGRAFDRMPILADALEDAGCTSDDVLDHCRGAGPHVRGCWVVDLILGKE